MVLRPPVGLWDMVESYAETKNTTVNLAACELLALAVGYREGV